MPSHTFMHTGHFEDAVSVNAAATYVAPRPGGPANDNVYPLHNRYARSKRNPSPSCSFQTDQHTWISSTHTVGFCCAGFCCASVEFGNRKAVHFFVQDASIDSVTHYVCIIQGVPGLGAPD